MHAHIHTQKNTYIYAFTSASVLELDKAFEECLLHAKRVGGGLVILQMAGGLLGIGADRYVYMTV
jgi:hypothetical protein